MLEVVERIRELQGTGIRLVLADDLKTFLNDHPLISDMTDDSPPGQLEYSLRLDTDAVRRAGFQPPMIARTVALLVDGEVAAAMQDRGEEVELRGARPASSRRRRHDSGRWPLL